MVYLTHYLYNQSVTVYTDHTAVKAVLETPNPTGKHARWWLKVYGQGVRDVKIVGRLHGNADALSRTPQLPVPQADKELKEGEAQVCLVADIVEVSDVETLLKANPVLTVPASFAEEQRKDAEIMSLLEKGELPTNQKLVN